MARKPWCRVLYWFAVLLDTERINREVDEVQALSQAKIDAASFHEPDRIWRAYDDAVTRLSTPAYAPLDRESMIREAKALMALHRGLPMIPEPVS